MSFIRNLYTLILDALFPLLPEERVLFSYSPEKAYQELPRSPHSITPNTQSLFAYKDERVVKLIWNIKYKKSKPALEIGGYALYQYLAGPRGCALFSSKPNEVVTESTRTLPCLEEKSAQPRGPHIILIPIPITTKRRRERGFNQCELLVAEIQRLDIRKHFSVRTDVLIRTQHSSRQTLKDRAHRLEDARGIFSVNEPVIKEISSRYPSPLFIIIDDVITTGSTMSEALGTLKKVGCDARGLSLAH